MQDILWKAHCKSADWVKDHKTVLWFAAAIVNSESHNFKRKELPWLQRCPVNIVSEQSHLYPLNMLWQGALFIHGKFWHCRAMSGHPSSIPYRAPPWKEERLVFVQDFCLIWKPQESAFHWFAEHNSRMTNVWVKHTRPRQCDFLVMHVAKAILRDLCYLTKTSGLQLSFLLFWKHTWSREYLGRSRNSPSPLRRKSNTQPRKYSFEVLVHRCHGVRSCAVLSMPPENTRIA